MSAPLFKNACTFPKNIYDFLFNIYNYMDLNVVFQPCWQPQFTLILRHHESESLWSVETGSALYTVSNVLFIHAF